MNILGRSSFWGFGRDKMAKRAAIKEASVAAYVDRLQRATTDRSAFDEVLADLKGDKQLKAADVMAIAQRYNRGGKSAQSKAAALAAISKRFVEIVRFHAKNKVAEKVRPW